MFAAAIGRKCPTYVKKFFRGYILFPVKIMIYLFCHQLLICVNVLYCRNMRGQRGQNRSTCTEQSGRQGKDVVRGSMQGGLWSMRHLRRAEKP